MNGAHLCACIHTLPHTHIEYPPDARAVPCIYAAWYACLVYGACTVRCAYTIDVESDMIMGRRITSLELTCILFITLSSPTLLPSPPRRHLAPPSASRSTHSHLCTWHCAHGRPTTCFPRRMLDRSAYALRVFCCEYMYTPEYIYILRSSCVHLLHPIIPQHPHTDTLPLILYCRHLPGALWQHRCERVQSSAWGHADQTVLRQYNVHCC